MDQALSTLFPIDRIGSDGFNWWIGQIEGTAADEPNNKGGSRYKVRIVGEHPQSKELLDTKELPRCNIMMPCNVPFMPGNTGGANSQLEKGCWVVGFYLDNEKQMPLIMGSIGQTPAATTIVKPYSPTGIPFETRLAQNVNPAKDGKPAPDNEKGGPSTETNKSTGGLSDGTVGKDNKPRIPIAPAPAIGDKEENWCQSVAEKCDKEDLSTKLTGIIGEMLEAVQNNGGQLGDFLVNKYTGGLYDAVGVVRQKTNKALSVIREFIAKIKGYIIGKLKLAVETLIKAILFPTPTGNVLTPVTEFFNRLLKQLGCQMADLGERLAEWLTNVLMDLVNKIYRAIACQIDALVNGILSKISSLIESLLNDILGPISDILGAIAGPLNIIGGALNYIMNLLGISCSGPDKTCAKYKKVCTTGVQKKEEKEGKDFLDDLLSGIDKLFPSTASDYTTYVCEDAYEGNPLVVTTVGVVGGVLKGTTSESAKNIIFYNINDVQVVEGEDAKFTITRSGYLEQASSVNFVTLTEQGTATAQSDYLPITDLIGFLPGETTKEVSIKTFHDQEQEGEEIFFVQINLYTPGNGSTTKTEFIKNVGKCTIKAVISGGAADDDTLPSPKPVNPFDKIDKVFTPTIVGPKVLQKNIIKSGAGNPNQNNSTTSQTFDVTASKTSIKKGEFVIFNIDTSNVSNGSQFSYTLTGVTQSDVLDKSLTGKFVVSNNKSSVTIGIAENNIAEPVKTLTFTININGASDSVLIIPDPNSDGSGNNLKDYDEGKGEGSDDIFIEFDPPIFDVDKIITDPNGGIITIPVAKPGAPWAEPPYIFIDGGGLGATAAALLDEKGYLTEVRVTTPGYNYTINLASNKNLRCIIDSFTVVRPGVGYNDIPKMYVNGELGVAEALVNDDGFVIGARILNRTLTFEKFPEIILVGGGGYGALLLPSLVCLDELALSTVGATKIGTGRYVDCP